MSRKQQKLLSLCIITKNEGKKLPLCLEHVKRIADEVIVVDTGSDDPTVQIAKQAGAKVYRMEWTNDFGAVRNYALDRATAKWILFLDADEILSAEDANRIRPLLDNPMAEGYLLYIYTQMENHPPSPPTQSLRLFRNRKEYRYRNRVFERIPEELITSVKDAGISILHRPDPERHSQIHQVKMELLEEEIRDHPTDSYLRYVYGIELLNDKKSEQCVEQFREAMTYLNQAHIFAAHLYKCLAWSLISIKRYQEAIDTINQGLKIFPFYTDLLFLRGQCYKELRNYRESIKDFETCLQLGEPPNSMVPDPGVGSFKALLALGEIHHELLNKENALNSYKRAFEYDPAFTEPLYRIGALVKDNPDLGEIDSILLKWIDSSDPDQLMTLIDILCLEREYEKALVYTENVQSAIGMREDIGFVKGICYTMMGEPKKAEEYFLMIKSDSPYYHQVLLRRIQNCWLHDRWKEAGILLEEMSQSNKLPEPTKHVYGEIHALLTGEETEQYRELDERGYEILSKLIENFLWRKQVPNAKKLLDWLLLSKQEHLFIKVGEMLSDHNDWSTVEMIFHHMKNADRQVQYKETIAERLIQNENFEGAEKILRYGNTSDLGVNGYLIWSRIWVHRTLEILGVGTRSRKVDQGTKNKLFQLMECITNEN